MKKKLPFLFCVISFSLYFLALLHPSQVFADDPIGKIIAPSGGLLATEPIDPSGKFTGVTSLLNSFLKLIFIAAGLWGFLNIIFAGFSFINAGGDPKNITKAWDKIWQSILGLLIIVVSFLLAAIIGIILFGNPLAILQPSL